MVDPDNIPPAEPSRARVALAHDWLVGMRGGELVLDRLVRLVRDHHHPAHLYCMFDSGEPHTPAIDALGKRVSFLNRLPARGRRWLLPLYPRAVASLSKRLARDHAREPIDLVVSTSSAAIMGLRSPAGVPHLCYCHAPARYVWSQTREYSEGSSLRALGLRLFGPRFRGWNRRAAGRVTRFLANSAHTAREIDRCFGRDAAVVHPPVRTDFFTPDEDAERGERWLFVGALEPYKRADLAIAAAMEAGVPLDIVGDGSDRARLERLAARAPGMAFLGRVPDEQLRDLYRTRRCLLFPQIEDFGIVAVEAQACGMPVVARRAGGALDSVIEHETGSFFDEPTSRAMLAAIERLPSGADAACRRNAERFSEEAFDRRMREAIERTLGSTAGAGTGDSRPARACGAGS